MLLGPKGPLVCCGYPCRGVLNTPHRAPPSVAKTRTRVPVRPVGAPDHSPGRNPGRAGYPMRSNTGGAVYPFGPGARGEYTYPAFIHSGPGARLGGRMRYAPGVRPGLWSTGPTARPGTCIRCLQTPILPADGCRDRRRRHRCRRLIRRRGYLIRRLHRVSWDLSASRHRASSVPSVPWAAWDLWDPSAA